jgi:putative endonuclease
MDLNFVYILQNTKGETYVGQTSNLNQRIAQHNDPFYLGSLHTKRHPGPWHLLYYETFNTRSAAMKREKELKTGKGREWIKLNILNQKKELMSDPATGC